MASDLVTLADRRLVQERSTVMLLSSRSSKTRITPRVGNEYGVPPIPLFGHYCDIA